MASKTDILNKTYNRGQKPFRFTLSEASEGVLVLHHSPDGWMDAETTYSRHKVYRSVLRNTSTNELTFYKEGRDFIRNVYENSGIDANITLTVEKLNKTTWAYESYPSANKIDLATYIINEIGVSVQLMDTQFKEKLINRDSTEVDILKLTTIEGLVVSPFTTELITMPDTSINLTSTFEDGGSPIKATTPHVVPITTLASDFTETQTPIDSVNTKVGSFFKESVQPRIIQATGNITGDLQFSGTGSYEFTLVVIDSASVIKTITTIGTGSSSHVSGFVNIDLDYNFFLTLATGDSICLQCSFVGIEIVYGLIDHNANETYTGSPETIVKAYPYYEALLRVGQLITDKEDCLTSTKFGRTDTPITTYASDGEIGFVTRGIFFRQTDNVIGTIPLTFKDLFNSLTAIFRIGMGVESNKMVVEDLDYFYDANIVVDLSDLLREQDIEKQVISEMFYKSVDLGYGKFEYLSNAGLFEFNTKGTWTTVIKSVINDLKQSVKYRADGQGMRLILAAKGQPDYDPTEDVKGEDDIFIIDAVRDGVTFIARTDEGFDTVGGSVYASSSFNLRYSPGRMLRTWGADIKAGLVHSLNTLLRWQATEKNSTLTSKLTAESYTVDEDGDVLVNDLNANRWLNEKYVIKVPLTTAQLNAIDNYPNRLIKLADEKYGWILELKTNNEDGMAEMELLRCNLNNVTPI